MIPALPGSVAGCFRPIRPFFAYFLVVVPHFPDAHLVIGRHIKFLNCLITIYCVTKPVFWHALGNSKSTEA